MINKLYFYKDLAFEVGIVDYSEPIERHQPRLQRFHQRLTCPLLQILEPERLRETWTYKRQVQD